MLSHFIRGNNFAVQGDYESAANEYNQCLYYSPEPVFFYNLGVAQ